MNGLLFYLNELSGSKYKALARLNLLKQANQRMPLFISVLTLPMQNNMPPNFFIEDSSLVTENVGDGVSRKMVSYNEHLMLVKVLFEKGAIGAVHQ